MISRLFLLALALLSQSASAFTNTVPQTQQLVVPSSTLILTAHPTHNDDEVISSNAPLPRWTASFAALATSAAAVLPALADDDVQFAELPPPYVPALFGLGLLVGVGVLTGSLGNVMDEEASLGMQSGARAKKEIERSRSSYFKK